MKYFFLILAFSGSLFSAQAILPQASRPYMHTDSYGQAQLYRPRQQLYGLQVQPYGQFQTYGQPYYPYYAPYQPDNGPMRGPNSIEGHKYNPYLYRP